MLYGRSVVSHTVPCPVLSAPDNGGVSYSNGITGAPIPTSIVATYSCSSAFTRVGDSTRTCQSGGTWTGSAPICQSKLLL